MSPFFQDYLVARVCQGLRSHVPGPVSVLGTGCQRSFLVAFWPGSHSAIFWLIVTCIPSARGDDALKTFKFVVARLRCISVRAVVGSPDVPRVVFLGLFFMTIAGLACFLLVHPESFIDADKPWKFFRSLAFPCFAPLVVVNSSAGVGLEKLDSPCCVFFAGSFACFVLLSSDCRVLVVD